MNLQEIAKSVDKTDRELMIKAVEENRSLQSKF